MLLHIKLLKPPLHPLQTRTGHAIPQNLSTTPSRLIPKQCNTVSRRELVLFTNSSLLLLLSSQTLDPFLVSKARADETMEEIQGEDGQLQTDTNEIAQEVEAEKPESISEKSVTVLTKRAFLDVSIAGKPAGRIIIRLNEDSTPVGSARFSDLVSGKAGISFRRKEFVKILPNYVQHGGVRSYGVDAELASKTGRSLTNERLIEEWERLNESRGTKNLAGTVSIIIRDPVKPPPKIKLVARQGKLVVDQEEVGVEPNGTEFTIATKDSPELDASALVVGEVVEGMDVVEKIGQVKTVQENTSSPYFKVAKLIGDKRAVVAERGFNRPYSKVTVMNCGLLE